MGNTFDVYEQVIDKLPGKGWWLIPGNDSWGTYRRRQPKDTGESYSAGWTQVQAKNPNYDPNERYSKQTRALKTLADVSEFTGITEWQAVKHTHDRHVMWAWCDASVDLSDVTTTRFGAKVEWFRNVEPCTRVTATDQGRWTSYDLCGAVANSDRPGLCKRHAAAIQRSKDADARREAEWQAYRERTDEKRRNRQANQDWAERLTAEFGIRFEPGDSDHVRVQVEPETLYKLMAEAKMELAAVMGEASPFETNRKDRT